MRRALSSLADDDPPNDFERELDIILAGIEAVVREAR
jgi:hypothetical protein